MKLLVFRLCFLFLSFLLLCSKTCPVIAGAVMCYGLMCMAKSYMTSYVETEFVLFYFFISLYCNTTSDCQRYNGWTILNFLLILCMLVTVPVPCRPSSLHSTASQRCLVSPSCLDFHPSLCSRQYVLQLLQNHTFVHKP